MLDMNNSERQTIGRTSLQYRTWGGIVNPMLMAVPMQSANAFSVMQVTNNFNTECNNFLNELGRLKRNLQSAVNERLSIDPNFTDYRQKGVNLAWKYEQADVKMGGNGSANWNENQRLELLEAGGNPKVRNYVGHHQKNVVHHPQHQANPSNIRFLHEDDHLNIGHDGNYRNPTDAPFIDKEEMLNHTNKKRVINNELKGVGLAALIGFATGASIGFIVTLAQNGLSLETFKLAAIEGGKVGLEGMAFGVIGHIASRTIGELATHAMTGLLANVGVELTENLVKACNMGVIGSVIIVTSSIYQFVRLKRNGYSTEECLMRVGKQALVSVGSLAVSTMVQATLGTGPAILVGVSIAAITLSYSMYQLYHNKVLAEKIQGYIIEKSFSTNII